MTEKSKHYLLFLYVGWIVALLLMRLINDKPADQETVQCSNGFVGVGRIYYRQESTHIRIIRDDGEMWYVPAPGETCIFTDN